jgi:hypothetical protein
MSEDSRGHGHSVSESAEAAPHPAFGHPLPGGARDEIAAAAVTLIEDSQGNAGCAELPMSDSAAHPRILDNEASSLPDPPASEQPTSPTNPDARSHPDTTTHPPNRDNEPDFASLDQHDWGRTATAARAGLLTPTSLKSMVMRELRRREADATSWDRLPRHERRRQRDRARNCNTKKGFPSPHKSIEFRDESPILSPLPPVDFESLLTNVHRQLEDELT